MGLRHRVIQSPQVVPGGPKLNRTRQIHAVSVVDAPEVQHRRIPRLEPARSVGRACGRTLLGPDATMVSNAGRQNPASRIATSSSNATSRSRLPADTKDGSRRAIADSRRPASRNVAISSWSLTIAYPLDQPLRRDHRRGPMVGLQREWRPGGKRAPKCVEAADRQPRRFHAGANNGLSFQDSYDRFVVAAFSDFHGEQIGRQSCSDLLCRRHVPEVNQEQAPRPGQNDRARSTLKTPSDSGRWADA